MSHSVSSRHPRRSDRLADDWTEKYRPTGLDAVIGNPGAVKSLREWAASWSKGIPAKRACVISGTPGIGKTTSALALARDMGWGIVEMNASDQRTGDAIRNVALRGAYFNTFDDSGDYLSTKDGGMKLIILDEADSLFGNADRGAMPAINELIKTTRQPVVLIVNDLYALTKKSSAVKSDTLQIVFRKPPARSISLALKKILDNEGISADPVLLDRIADNSAGDMRAAIRDLESVALGRRSVSADASEVLTERIIRKDMYDLMDSIFRKSDPMGSRMMVSKTDTDPDTMMLWVEENLPYEYREPGDLVRGYEKLSRSDIFLGRVHRRQYYGLWGYANDLMTAGVAISRFSNFVNRERIRFPMYLMKMSRSKAVRAMKYSICTKLAIYLHTSTARISNDVLQYIKRMAINDAEIRRLLAIDAGFDPEELGFLLGEKMDSPIVKTAFLAEAKKVQESKPMKEEYIPPVAKIEAKAPEQPKEKGKQRSLFEF